jgi:hypothetical protein
VLERLAELVAAAPRLAAARKFVTPTSNRKNFSVSIRRRCLTRPGRNPKAEERVLEELEVAPHDLRGYAGLTRHVRVVQELAGRERSDAQKLRE